ncbi:MAG: ABC transporter ATP-binding protein [Ectothiorhodospiraceae bacterium]|nr:ABC transporter ATP-binding protein [Ectothiorhodospiraceae bacterium]
MAPRSTARRAVSEAATLLEVRDLRVEFRSGLETVHAVNGATFDVRAGETAAILGESGCGKSVTAAAIMRLLPQPPARITAGEIRFDGESVLTMSRPRWRQIAGRRIGMVFQDALSSLNPVFSVGWQIAEAFRVHGEASRAERRRRAIELLDRVGISGAATRVDHFPHQFSGGMRQRVMIAMAVALGPSLLIADEPTTALDVTIQAQIMDLLASLRAEYGMAMVLISHDLGVVSEVADRVAVMYAGRVVESGPTREVLRRPSHPYTLALLRSVPGGKSKAQKLHPIVGSPPDLARMPVGCAFHPRCEMAREICTRVAPPCTVVEGASGATRTVECHFAAEVASGRVA